MYPKGYTYEVSSYEAPVRPYQDSYDSDAYLLAKEPPLMDIAILGDFNILNDSHESKSYTLPKIGDARDFVDIRRNLYSRHKY